MKKRALSLLLAALFLMTAIFSVSVFSVAAEDVTLTPLHGEPFQPEGVTFGRVSFIVPGGTAGLTKDAWDDNIDHNTDLILISYVKDGVIYENKTPREIKEHLGNKALMRTCYTYDDRPDGTLQLNLVFHMDDHSALKPADIIAVTVKAGFVWCAGSPAGIQSELSQLKLDRDVSFVTKGEAGITAVKAGNMGSNGTSLHVRFDRNDSESLKAISTVNLCPSAIPGKTLGDLVTINGVTVTELVQQNKVARFNFFGDTLVFHVDDDEFRNAMLNENYEIVILPGFRWMNWTQDDWGNWAGTHANDYTPVEGTLVTQPLSFFFDAEGAVVIHTDGISVVPGYKDTYYVGDPLDMTTLLISINYADGRSEETPILESMCTYDFSAPGQTEVKITLNDMTTSYTVTVLPREEASESETEPVTEPESESVTEPESEPVTEFGTEVVSEPEESETESLTPQESVSDETATASPDVTDTETTTEAVTVNGGTEATEAQGGCGSSVMAGSAILGAALVGFAIVRKKKEI